MDRVFASRIITITRFVKPQYIIRSRNAKSKFVSWSDGELDLSRRCWRQTRRDNLLFAETVSSNKLDIPFYMYVFQNFKQTQTSTILAIRRVQRVPGLSTRDW